MRLTSLTHPAMVVDESYVYFRDADDTLKRVPVGGAVQVLAVNTCCGGLALDADFVYWGQWGSRGLDIAGTLEATQSRVGCRPEVPGVWLPGDVDDTADLAVAGRHLWAGVQVQVEGQPAQAVQPSPDGTAVTFHLPAGLAPGRYDLQVGRPQPAGAGLAHRSGLAGPHPHPLLAP